MIYENEYNLNVTITSRRQLVELIEIYFNVCKLVKIHFQENSEILWSTHCNLDATTIRNELL